VWRLWCGNEEGKEMKMQAGDIRRLIFGAAELLILNQYFKKGNDNNRRRGFK
jgi:hypothetical protein